VESINVKIDKIGKPESKEEENRSMKQPLEEEAEDEKEVEEEYEENLTETKEQVQQVSPKTPSRRVQKNHPSDQIIGNKDAGVETRRKIVIQTHLHSYLQLNQTILKKPTMMNFGISPWMKNWIK
jgi:hypothetical protein